MDQHFQILLERYLKGELSTAEREPFIQKISTGDYVDDFARFVDITLQNGDFDLEENQELKELIYRRVRESISYPVPGGDSPVVPIRRIHFLRTAWLRYAAAIVLVVGIAALIMIFKGHKNGTDQSLVSTGNTVPATITPGGNRAVLTLSDGTKITLNNAANGAIAQQGNTEVIKRANGQLEYKLLGLSQQQLMLNTMSTPRGGQYQLTLPDGTKVWLNAASSISYPVAFIEAQRKVSVTGEAYFEVAKDQSKPFFVTIGEGRNEVEVLGTHFNINAYSNEDSVKTTLLEGKIKISASQTSELLSPGQQAKIANSASAGAGITIISNADTEQAIAWKNGGFSFDNTDIRVIMRQVERWYDVEVIYEGDVGARSFNGGTSRSTSIDKLLEMLEYMNVHFRVEGRKIIVTP